MLYTVHIVVSGVKYVHVSILLCISTRTSYMSGFCKCACLRVCVRVLAQDNFSGCVYRSYVYMYISWHASVLASVCARARVTVCMSVTYVLHLTVSLSRVKNV